MEHPVAPGTLLGGWTVGKVLGKGAFGYVQEATRKDLPGEVFAIKMCGLIGKGADKVPKTNNSKQAIMLSKEYTIYSTALRMPGNRHIVTLPSKNFGDDAVAKLRWLVMPLLGKSLNDYLEAAGGTLPWSAVANIGVQMVSTRPRTAHTITHTSV